MQFSNTTEKNGLIQRCERYTNLGDGVISGDSTLLAYFTTDINETQYELMTEIMKSQDTFEWDDPNRVDYPIATTPLVADQRDYQFDSISFLKLRRVDVTYDGSNYYRATPFDSSSYLQGFGNDTDVDANFDKTSPKYDPKAFGLWLYPRASATDVASGAKLRIEFTRAFDEFATTDTTQEPPIDRPFHDLIAIGASYKWAATKGNRNRDELLAMYKEGIENLKRYYNNRNEDMMMILNPQIDDYR